MDENELNENDAPRVRDLRTKRRYFADNIIYAKYGRLIGPYGLSVYHALCYHANLASQQCWPSYATLAEEIGCSPRKVADAVAQLVDLGLISKESRFDDGGQKSNLYTILNPPGIVQMPPHAGDTSPHAEDSPPPCRKKHPPHAEDANEQSEVNNPNRTTNSTTTTAPTQHYVNGDIDDSITENAEEPVGNAFRDPVVQAYMRCVPGLPGALLLDQLLALVDETEEFRLKLPRGVPGADKTGQEWVLAAIDVAARSADNGRFNLRYLEAIIDRWEKDGFMAERKQARYNNRASAAEERRKRRANIGAPGKDYAEGW